MSPGSPGGQDIMGRWPQPKVQWFPLFYHQMKQHTQQHEHVTCPRGRMHLIYTRWRCTSIQYTLSLCILRHACSKGFNLCWKEQFWLRSQELFVGDRPVGGACFCLKLHFPLGGHPTLTPIHGWFALYHLLNHQIFTQRPPQAAWDRPWEDCKGGEDMVLALKELWFWTWWKIRTTGFER